MAKEFSRIPLERLCNWVLQEYETTGQIFGIHQDLWFTPRPEQRYTLQRFGRLLETPLGVAAGPQTQMAQNIIAAWLCGSRYLELKTVQTLDELNVSKPCIDMQDEGYNCEWSQELRLDDSFDEYLNAWIMLHILRHRFAWKHPENELGFIFNMSVGYNLDGIRQANVQRFFDRMADCRTELQGKIEAVRRLYPAVTELDIPSCLSDNITLSTMHGCPPDEIEKIARYLISERGYHTTVKFNPTLLGPDHLRHILNDQLGFVTHVPDEAFGHDLKYPDALALIKNLRVAAAAKGVVFSLKLTNTLESVNHKNVFPANEKMMYMSGRALHPISVNVAAKLQDDFDGELDLTFSAGADCFNVAKIIACGIKPVTMSSDLLKPGGYGRQLQYLQELERAMVIENATTLDQYVCHVAGLESCDQRRARLINLRRYAGAAPNLPEYRRSAKIGDSVKTARELSLFDCVHAPCIATCPGGQDIPSYLYHTAKGDFAEAWRVILRTNPFPNVLGMVCDHQCQYRCTRSNYDQPLLIREIKRFVTTAVEARPKLRPGPRKNKKVAVIGAGPSGLSCAYFLALNGYEVKVFETRAFAGGMVSDAIPTFRLTETAIRKDIAGIEALGVAIQYDTKIDKDSFPRLCREFDFVYIAIGAQTARKMSVPGEDANGVISQLQFLSDVRRGRPVVLGPKVAVIGGGNSAMDAARTAQRLVGANGQVTVVYRRTREEMPADREEIKALADEKIAVLELHQPLEVLVQERRVVGLKCARMRLGQPGADGRRRPENTGTTLELPFDTIIPAIGQDAIIDFVNPEDLVTDPGTGMTKLENVFAGGDLVRGAATIIQAVGDGQTAALNIMAKHNIAVEIGPEKLQKGLTLNEFQQRSAMRTKGLTLPESSPDQRVGFDLVIRDLTADEARKEAARCLYCNDVCNVCVSVCPNRANRSYQTTPRDIPVFVAIRDGDGYRLEKTRTQRIAQDVQTFNIGDFCNECGNCTTFCPTAGAPYKDKPKFYLTETSFQAEQDGYLLLPGKLRARFGGQEATLEERDGALWYFADGIEARIDAQSLAVDLVRAQQAAPERVDLERVVPMAVLYTSLKDQPFCC